MRLSATIRRQVTGRAAVTVTRAAMRPGLCGRYQVARPLPQVGGMLPPHPGPRPGPHRSAAVTATRAAMRGQRTRRPR